MPFPSTMELTTMPPPYTVLPPSRGFLASKKPIFRWTALILWNFACALDATALTTSLPSIAHDLSATSNQAFWTGTGFVLCSAVLQPLWTSLAQGYVVGRKPVALLALFFFTVGAVICGWATSIQMLIGGRCVQGAGGGGLLALTYVLIADHVELSQRGRVTGLAVGLSWTAGTTLGPLIGGAFTTAVVWRWIFWINLPICGICAACAVVGLEGEVFNRWAIVHGFNNVDWIGTGLFVGSMASLLIGLSFGGIMYPWTSGHVLAPIVVGGVGVVFWAFYSTLLTARPMIPIRPLLANYISVICYLGNLVQGICQYGVLFYLPLYFQAVKGYSSIISGVAMLAVMLVSGPTTSITGVLITKWQRVKPFLIVGWVFLAFGIWLLEYLEPTTNIASWIFLTAPAGVGVGMLFAPLAVATQAAVERDGLSHAEYARLMGTAAGLNPFFRALGQSIGIVVSQAAFTNTMARKVGLDYALEAAALGEIIKALPVDSHERMALVESFSESLHTVWWVLMAPPGVWALITILWTEYRYEGVYSFDHSNIAA